MPWRRSFLIAGVRNPTRRIRMAGLESVVSEDESRSCGRSSESSRDVRPIKDGTAGSARTRGLARARGGSATRTGTRLRFEIGRAESSPSRSVSRPPGSSVPILIGRTSRLWARTWCSSAGQGARQVLVRSSARWSRPQAPRGGAGLDGVLSYYSRECSRRTHFLTRVLSARR